LFLREAPQQAVVGCRVPRRIHKVRSRAILPRNADDRDVLSPHHRSVARVGRVVALQFDQSRPFVGVRRTELRAGMRHLLRAGEVPPDARGSLAETGARCQSQYRASAAPMVVLRVMEKLLSPGVPGSGQFAIGTSQCTGQATHCAGAGMTPEYGCLPHGAATSLPAGASGRAIRTAIRSHPCAVSDATALLFSASSTLGASTNAVHVTCRPVRLSRSAALR